MPSPVVCDSPLSVHRAFVVQFRAETDPALGHAAGRVEHIASQQSVLFRSWEELQAFVTRVLGQAKAQRPQKP